MMQRAVMLLSVCLMAGQAAAFKARPVSDLRFDGRFPFAPETISRAIASDGKDFLVVSSNGSPYWDGDALFTQVIRNGRAAGPLRQIGEGEPLGLYWNGSEYLLSYDTGNGMRVARVSREGSLISVSEPVVPGYHPRLAVSRTSALGFGRWPEFQKTLTTYPLDLAGNPTAAPVAHPWATSWCIPVVGEAAGGAFAAVCLDGVSSLMLFRGNGTAITPAPVLFETPRAHQGFIATDGTDTLIVFNSGESAGDGELRSLVVDANGAMKQTSVVHRIAGASLYGLQPRGLVWTGSEYVLAMHIDVAPLNARPSAALVRLNRDGKPSGPIVVIPNNESRQAAEGLGWNGRDLLVLMTRSFALVDPSTMTPYPAEKLGQTVTQQSDLVLEAGPGGYLAAWFDRDETGRTVRASRVDAAGNYLDGQGIVLGSAGPLRYGGNIAIDWNGSVWTLAWSDGTKIHARSLSSDGVPAGIEPMAITTGSAVDILSDGAGYVLLRSHEESLYTDVVSADGVVLDTRLLAKYKEEERTDVYSYTRTFISYEQPKLLRLRQRAIALFGRRETVCHPGGGLPPCGDNVSVMGLLLDEPGAEPFTAIEWGDGTIGVASDSGGAMAVLGSQGAYLPADTPDQPAAPFPIPSAYSAVVAHDGEDFVAAGWRLLREDWPWRIALVTARITSTGTVTDARTLFDVPYNEGRHQVTIAASASLRPLIGVVHRYAAYDNIERGQLLFVEEAVAVSQELSAPSKPCVARDAQGVVSLRWPGMAGVLAFSAEAQLEDGTFRAVAVAPGGATSARIPETGIAFDAVRLRAWNAAGPSLPSSAVPTITPPSVVLRSATKACANVPVTITFTLSGTPPFNVHWSDGLVQTHQTRQASRVVTLARNTTLRIVSVSDAGCWIDTTPRTIGIVVDPPPALTAPTTAVEVARGNAATLSITAENATSIEWYEGISGDLSKLVATDADTYATPLLFQTTRYWVRVSNRCGSVDSPTITVTVPGKRRSVR